MARRPTGAVLSHVGQDGRTYRSIRFTAFGKRRFVSLGPVSEAEAQRQLRYALTDIERGTWQPAQAVEAPPEAEPVATFHQYAETWWTLNVGGWSERTIDDYKWRLERKGGLVDHFGEIPVDKIKVATVDGFRAEKLAEATRIREAAANGSPIMEEITDKRGHTFTRPARPLSARSINMMINLLATILDSAFEDEESEQKNPAAGKKRRVKERKPARSYLDSADSIQALLDAAGQMDADARHDGEHVHRKGILTTLIFSGVRISELCELRWRDVNLAAGWLSVGKAKTDAGTRRIRIRGILRDALLAIKPDGAVDRYVFCTSNGGPSNPSNVRNRLLKPATQAASAELVERGGVPLPHLTPHSLRRTFATVLFAVGESPALVMREMGHTSPALALTVYAQALELDDTEKARLKALVEGHEMGQTIETTSAAVEVG